MKAMQIRRFDGPTSLELVDAPEPVESDAVTVTVRCAGVTFPDVLQTRGEYQHRPPLPYSPGGEVAGVVRSAPAGSHVRTGDRVAAFAMSGGFAELFVTRPDLVFPLPDSVPFERAAAVPVNYLTSHFALIQRGRLEPGQTVLVHGAAGGVGSASCQLAAAFGARVIAVVSNAEKAALARAAGAHETVPVEGFLESVRELTDGRGVDLVVDPVGGDRFTDSLRTLAREGTLLVVGFAGRSIPQVKVNRLLLTNTSVVGVAWGEYALRTPGFAARQWADLLPLLASGQVDPVVASVYPLDQASEALRELDERRVLGRVVLRVTD